MSNIKSYLAGEFIFLFVLIPCLLPFDIPGVIKAGIVLSGIAYVIRTVIKNQLITRKSLYAMSFKTYWKIILFRFIILIISSIIFMYIFNGENLFIVLRKNPVMWLMVSIFYSVVSVYPQEFLYRSFFFNRYGLLFKSPYVIIIVNAMVFCLAHVMFRSLLVLAITLIGGVILSITYYKTRSLLLTSIEHALYGSWLFTVGMGEMLAFPMPE